MTNRQMLESQYKAARMNLLFVIGFTLFNIVMIFFESSSYFIFSAILPYHLVLEGAFWCGFFPLEYYEGLGIYEFLDISFFIELLIVALLIVAVYVVFWMLSKKRVGFLIAATVLMGIDTLALIYLYGISGSVIDLAFHGIVIFLLVRGILAFYKLKNLPNEPLVNEPIENTAEENTDAGSDFTSQSADAQSTDSFDSQFDYSDRDNLDN